MSDKTSNLRKIDPKLRMYQDCDQSVNEARAYQNANLYIADKVKLTEFEITEDIGKVPPKNDEKFRKVSLRQRSNNISSHVFVKLAGSEAVKKLKGEMMRNGNIASVFLPITELASIAEQPEVVGIEVPRILKLDHPTVSSDTAIKSEDAYLKNLRSQYSPKHKVLVGIIDVGGFDFAHPDFLDGKGNTRFLRIWDQGSEWREPPVKYNLDYGAEFLGEHLNKALRDAKRAGVPATALEKQSAMSTGSHGTHVASIAAGNSGACPDAGIVGVTIALTKSDMDRRRSFYDSSSLVHAVHYLLSVAKELNRPISINISLGTNGHAHDGSDAASRWINAELSLPGRCVCVAAGNAGQEKALSVNDLGYVSGRIHTSGKIPATGLSKDIFWTVAGNGFVDISENELEIWYAPQDRISIMIKPPDLDWIGPVKPNEFIESQQLEDGSFMSIYNELFHFANGCNYIAVYLSPNYKNSKLNVAVRSGIWQVRLIGEDIRSGEFDGWIERDDPHPIDARGDKRLWQFPSFFTEKSNVDNSSISSLACAHYVVAVGNCDVSKNNINVSSSQGPTRDKRHKPEVIAPGTDIVAAKGFSTPGDEWITMTGTSMASPYVCGIAALMLSLDKELSAAQIQGIIQRTSQPLPGCDYNWKDDCGFGLIEPSKCLEETIQLTNKKNVTK
ncbi:MAG: S8 family serine peptidase [Sediminibacterium sp.]